MTSLVTFIPDGPEDFHAHPITQMKAQSKELGIRHEGIRVSEPYRESYIAALAQLQSRGITCVVTGDIDRVDGHPNWITECAQTLNLAVALPLWNAPREELLRELVDRGIEARITYIKDSRIPSTWLHRTIDVPFIDDIKELAARTGIDLCGENGEYHTMVTRFP